MRETPSILENPASWFENQCKDLNVSVAKMCRFARIDNKMVCRWKKGEVDPSYHSIKRMHRAVSDYWARHRSDDDDE